MELSAALGEKLSPGSDKPAIRIGIVGCGSRGLTVLERICALAVNTARRIELNVFDPKPPGPGLHAVDQPEYLMLNTVASQISMFPDTAALDGHVGRQGPSFYEWCLRFKSAERNVQPNEYLPRSWLGEYLAWTYGEVIEGRPANVHVIHHPHAVDNIEHTDMGQFVLSTGELDCPVDWLAITIGHAQPSQGWNGKQPGSTSASLQPASVASVLSTEAVGIEGLGLSAMDVVASLTVGRAGHFRKLAGGLRYEPGGREPAIYMFSRSGLPYRTRPDIVPHRASNAALIFTLSAVASLRAENLGGLDFEQQVLPLIKAEMLAEYFGMIASQKGESTARIKAQIARAFYSDRLETVTAEMAAHFQALPLDEAVYNPRVSTLDAADYPQAMRAFIERDTAQSLLGLDSSPIKAAIEVWRSCREQLRRVVDNRGLTTYSGRVFFGEYAPHVNRMVAGPQKERHQELLALADAGIVHWVHHTQVIHSTEGAPTEVALARELAVPLQRVIKAHFSNAREIASLPKIIRTLKRSGVIHSLTENGEGVLVTSEGKAQPNLWITGPLVEGSTYYNHYVPSSGSYARAFVDADRIAREMLGLNVEVRAMV
ncbi:FAD/NAD(P)-binding protein [Pseudomonas sp. KU26590]|uniref:FAD/NAD(P)-binding protein n=1 Tax=Pseudomonas sp. KU26590 TaxID=2991051 RepID=UPI00223CBF8B|nr:FAD/NAD(P)-binding protein [Pseudomonas sp. KU26590]UZJ60499.1 FAD/NAD(P)-binding protein [Pseudomonas sp. KU26590]